MKFIVAFIFVILSLAPCVSAGEIKQTDVDRALKQLDTELERRADYMHARTERIDSLKTLRLKAAPRDSMRWLDLTMMVAKDYSSFNNDSALIYYTYGYDAALELSQSRRGTAAGARAGALAAEFRMRRATYLSLGGLITDAINEYEDIDTTTFDDNLRAVYHDAGRQMYSYIASFYDQWLGTYDYWKNRSVTSQRDMLPLLSPSTTQYQLNQGEYYYAMREYARAREVLLPLVSSVGVDTPAYAIACHILASIAATRGDRLEYIYYLTQSAISDMRQATLEVTSLQELAGVLFEGGDRRRAHEYVSVALHNAIDSRATVRIRNTTELLTMVEQNHSQQITQWRTWMYAIIAILVMCMIALSLTIFFLRRELTRVANMKRELITANEAKDVYIGQFMSLCSVYMDKLKQFGRLVNRKISAGQVEELAKLTKSGKFVEEQSSEFYRVFDDAFLHIYPGWVEAVNALLRPEEQITLAEGEQLNADLRILAFMRLGIDDTNRVAQILNFSVNTIYSYRNRLRNRAINRDTFEADIMAIGSKKE